MPFGWSALAPDDLRDVGEAPAAHDVDCVGDAVGRRPQEQHAVVGGDRRDVARLDGLEIAGRIRGRPRGGFNSSAPLRRSRSLSAGGGSNAVYVITRRTAVWLNMQRAYDLWRVEREMADEIAKIPTRRAA
jgi:hypothetical protein